MNDLVFVGATNNGVQIQGDQCKPGECTANCSDPWEENDDQCYLWSQEKLFWGVAEKKCRSLGGHLASVTSQDVNDYLLMNVRKYKTLSND